MRIGFRVLAAFSLAAVSSLAMASTKASATISLLSSSGGVYTYDIDLHNTGTTNIGTFWYAWVPGEDFMPDKPTAVIAPTGWNVNAITNGGAGDGYAIRWEDTTPLAAGKSLDGFRFSSVDSPTVINGNSPFYPNTPINTSFVYERGPFQGGSFQFQVTPVPEPPVLCAMGIGALGLFAFRKRK